MTKEYVHLHGHSTYSLGDATTNIAALAKRVASLGMKACALTDHGTMAGVAEFQKEFGKAGVKPIFGMEAYIAWDSATKDKSHANPTGHIILLAKDIEGYRNLCTLLDWSNRVGFFAKPRIDTEILAKHSKGLIGLSSCAGGLPQKAILGWSTHNAQTKERDKQGPQLELLDDIAMKMQDILGKGNFFLEIQNHRRKDPSVLSAGQREDYDWLERAQIEVAKNFLACSRRTGIPCVGTNDFHYLDETQAEGRKIVLAINDKQVLEDGFTGELQDPKAAIDKTVEQGAREVTGQMYVKSPEEMYETLLGHSFPSLLTNSIAIAEMCNVSIVPDRTPEGRIKFSLPEVPLEPEETLSHKFRRLVEEGYRIRYPGDPEVARKRLEFELAAMGKLGFETYHIIVADFVSWAKNNGIAVGDGRGSGAGSLVVYCLGITNIDPLRHGLIFERYINPERVTAPDLDVDFDPTRVAEVIAYCKKKYGEDHVAYIAAYQSIHAKGSIKKVGKVFRLNKEWMDQICDSLPDDQGEHRVKIKSLMEEKDSVSAASLVKFRKKGGKTAEKMLELCIMLDDVKIYRSEHAAGIVIGGVPLRERLPLASYDRENPDVLTAEIPHVHLEDMGFLKMDFLVTQGLTIIQRTVEYIRSGRNKDFRLKEEWEEPYDDRAAFDLLCRGATYGIWQLSSADIRRVCIELGPSSLDDIGALIALYRPGPLDYTDPELKLNMVEIFIRRKQGRLPIEYDAPCLKPILENTYGVIVYQEQLMYMSQTLCGWTMNQADKLRKAAGKKLPEEMEALRPKFIKDAMAHSSVEEDVAKKIWDKIAAFGRYGFNKAHSIGYGKMAYQTAVLKAHYPIEFLAACLARVVEKSDKDQRKGLTHFFVDECNRLGIPVLPPDVALSGVETKPEGNSIRLGLNLVNGIAEASGAKIVAAKVTPEDTLGNAILKLSAAKVGPAMMKDLISCGAFDRYGNPQGVLDVVTRYEKTKTSKKRFAEFFGLAPTMKAEDTPPLTPDQMEKTFFDSVNLTIEREKAPPLRRVVVTVKDPQDLEIFSEPGETDVYTWVRYGLPKSNWGLYYLGKRKVPLFVPPHIKVSERV